MTRCKVLFVFLVTTGMLLQACGASAEAVATSVAATLQVSQLETAAASDGQANGSSTENDSSGGEATVTGTPTPTSGIPLVSVSQDTNCRRGPRIDYDYVTTIAAGQQVEVLKTFPGEDYVVVANPNGSGDCWLWLQYADQTDFSTYGLAVATQPATPTPSPTPSPTPVYNWSGTWSVWIDTFNYTMTLTQSGGSITGTLDTGGNLITLNGSLSADWQIASGTWTKSGGASGSFQWRMLASLDQFQGNLDGGVESMCGARNGAGMPGTCAWP